MTDNPAGEPCPFCAISAGRAPRSSDGYSDRAVELSKILSDERVSTLMETFRILGWPLSFSVEDEESTRSPL